MKPVLASLGIALATVAATAGHQDFPGTPKLFEGHYWLRVRSGMDGKFFPAVDTIDIVAKGGGRADFLVDLVFYNGKVCRLAGSARLEGDRLAYRNSALRNKEGICALSFARRLEGLVMIEAPNQVCSAVTCGRRGRYFDTPFKNRRALRQSERRRVATEVADAESYLK